MVNVFSVPVFFIVFRETVEAAIILSVLLAVTALLHRNKEIDTPLYKRFRLMVWLGASLGLFCSLVIGGAFIGIWYTVAKNLWESAEALWEGIFSLVASVIISIMGVAILRIAHLKEKWFKKLSNDPRTRKESKSALFFLPFITVLREGIEAVIFVGGVSLNESASAFPLAVIVGLLVGIIIGVILYKGNHLFHLQLFLVISTCFLYLIGAGLFSKGVGYIEQHRWNRLTGGDSDEAGNAEGSYNVQTAVWHVNCCTPYDNGWGLFNAIFGWNNTATVGSVVSYCVYWIAVMVAFIYLKFRDDKRYRNETANGTTTTTNEKSLSHGNENSSNSSSDKV